jgi:hypothetical protein
MIQILEIQSNIFLAIKNCKKKKKDTKEYKTRIVIFIGILKTQIDMKYQLLCSLKQRQK